MRSAPARRFSAWSASAARLLLGAIAVAMLGMAIAGSRVPETAPAASSPVPGAAAAHRQQASRDTDLLLYDRVIERLAAGDGYYPAAVGEMRARSFPVRPALNVRLPTLATIQAWLGPVGTMAAAVVLVLAIGLAWWRRFADEGLAGSERRFAVALILAGSSFLLNPYYHVLHELWAGGLVALSLGLHRPGKCGSALAVAALALAIRELVLPFVLLMGVLAAARRDWREAFAWSALGVCFAVLIGWHQLLVAGHTTLADPQGPGWLALRGLPGWIEKIVLSSQLHLLPAAAGGPVVILALLGWAGRRTASGLTATLMLAGYGAAFMIVGRNDNFYWGLIVTPVLFAGLALVPAALGDLWRAAVRKNARGQDGGDETDRSGNPEEIAQDA
jgi:hypothetical protein